MDKADYWRECVEIAAEECGLILTPEQAEHMAGAFEGAHDSYGMAFYSPPAGEHLSSENETLRRELRDERDKVTCKECGGKGWILSACGPVRSSESQCWKCRGEGRHKP